MNRSSLLSLAVSLLPLSASANPALSWEQVAGAAQQSAASCGGCDGMAAASLGRRTLQESYGRGAKPASLASLAGEWLLVARNESYDTNGLVGPFSDGKPEVLKFQLIDLPFLAADGDKYVSVTDPNASGPMQAYPYSTGNAFGTGLMGCREVNGDLVCHAHSQGYKAYRRLTSKVEYAAASGLATDTLSSAYGRGKLPKAMSDLCGKWSLVGWTSYRAAGLNETLEFAAVPDEGFLGGGLLNVKDSSAVGAAAVAPTDQGREFSTGLMNCRALDAGLVCYHYNTRSFKTYRRVP